MTVYFYGKYLIYITKDGEKDKTIESIDSEKKKECFSSSNQC